jgi:hypothetical protein
MIERRRFARLTVTNEQFKLSSNQKIYAVSDLSENGLGLWISSDEDGSQFSVGGQMEGYLNLKGEKLFVAARVRSMSRDRVGCEFEKDSAGSGPELQELRQRLKVYLSPEFLGMGLKPIPQTDPSTIQYVGPSSTLLSVHRLPEGKEEQWDRFSLYFFHYFVQWETESDLATGHTVSTKNSSYVNGIFREESLDLVKDSEVDFEKLRIAKTILVSSKLPLDLKSWCLKKLER